MKTKSDLAEIESRKHKEELIKMIKNINDKGMIEYFYTFIKLFLEKWG